MRPLNLLRVLVSRKRICARLCACLPPSIYVRVCAHVSAQAAQPVTYTAAETTEGGRWARPNSDRRGGRHLPPLRLASRVHTHPHGLTHTNTHTHTYNNISAVTSPCMCLCVAKEGGKRCRPHPSPRMMNHSPSGRLV